MRIPMESQQKIISLREKGYSISEIAQQVKRGKGTVWRYAHSVPINPQYQSEWQKKRGGSTLRSQIKWNEARQKASGLLPEITDEHSLLLLACLYWAEGSKGEFCFINTDPSMIKKAYLFQPTI